MHDALFSVSRDGGSTVLSIAGDLVDAQACTTLGEAIETHSANYTKPLTVELSAVTFLPSAALGILALALQNSDRGAGGLVLAAEAGTIAQQVLEVTAIPHLAP